MDYADRSVATGMMDVLWAGARLDGLAELHDLVDAIGVLSERALASRVAIAWWHIRARMGRGAERIAPYRARARADLAGHGAAGALPVCARRRGVAYLCACRTACGGRSECDAHRAGAAGRAADRRPSCCAGRHNVKRQRVFASHLFRSHRHTGKTADRARLVRMATLGLAAAGRAKTSMAEHQGRARIS
jgi:hypothetical protein